MEGLLGLLGSGLSLGAIFLPWWDVGSSEAIFAVREAVTPVDLGGVMNAVFLGDATQITQFIYRDRKDYHDKRPHQYNGVVIWVLNFAQMRLGESQILVETRNYMKLYLPQSSKGVTSHHQKHPLRAEI